MSKYLLFWLTPTDQIEDVTIEGLLGTTDEEPFYGKRYVNEEHDIARPDWFKNGQSKTINLIIPQTDQFLDGGTMPDGKVRFGSIGWYRIPGT